MWFPIAHAADPINTPHSSFQDPFRPMDEDWPTPNDIRTASGAPGAHYWQQKVDYKMRVRLDVPTRTLHGDEEITYHNHSPDTLRYLWVLVDQDRFRNEALRERTRTTSPDAPVTFQEIERMQRMRTWQGGFTIEALNDGQGQALRHIVVDALMRVDLNHPLAPGATLRLHTTWSLPMIESSLLGGRSGYSCFEGHKLLRPGSPKVGGADHTVSCVYQAGQWFPRLAAYDDQGWHNDPFLGAGEFPLEFGDYDVSITVPSNHVVAATGELQNAAAVLTSPQRARLAAARTADHPIFVVTPAEAEAHERNPAAGEKTWTFKARNVRDFAFASSRKYIWDAMGVRVDGAKDLVTMAMSFYPNEGRPLWSTYATKAIAHTLRVYGRFTYPYPYPVAQATWGDIGGYENPMLSFIDGGLPRLDEITGAITYSARDKFGLVGEIIHETGHNWFPETVNSDERRWAWMDEGINSFLETEARELWDPAFPNVKGNPRSIVACMTAPDQVPIMVRPDYAPDTGCPFYLKPATALVVLRETVMGRELFDYAFREYARRWRFKRATPYDFFRTMQDASGVDLGWFWRGWFYGTDHVDVALERVVQGRLDTRDPDVEAAQSKRVADAEPKPLTVLRNTETPVVVADPSLRDFYDEPSSSSVSTAERERAKAALEKLKPEDRAALADPDHFYRFTFVNVGGLVTPIPLKLTYDDGSSEVIHIPVQVWRINSKRVVWPFATPKTLVSAEVDPAWETGDTDRSNNFYPGRIETQTFKIPDRSESSNPMRDQGLSVTRDSLKTVPVSHP
ncbi:MAG: M1 family metallopeptidase [Rhodanobacter sp.]